MRISLAILALALGVAVHDYTNVETVTKIEYRDNPFQVELLQRIFGEVPERTYSFKVTVTAYSASADETDSSPEYTADMTLSRVGLLAVSRDLLDEIGVEYGDTVILEGYGIFKVHDTMNKRFKRRVDILMGNKKAAFKFGKQKTILTLVR